MPPWVPGTSDMADWVLVYLVFSSRASANIHHHIVGSANQEGHAHRRLAVVGILHHSARNINQGWPKLILFSLAAPSSPSQTIQPSQRHRHPFHVEHLSSVVEL